MIEIVFSDSAAGSLKQAQHYGSGSYHACSSVFIIHSDGRKPTKWELWREKHKTDQRERRTRKKAVPLGGAPADVFGFPLALSVGSIAENDFDVQRQQTLKQLDHVLPSNIGTQTAQELLHQVKCSLQTVCTRTAAGEAIRIWCSNQPDELCGMYWLMAQLSRLKSFRAPLYLIWLPEWEVTENQTVRHAAGWGEVAPEEWGRYLPLQRPVPAVLRQSYAAHWQTLQTDNAALRAVINGQLVSVPEPFYDDFILREIASEQEEFQEAMVIGRILGKYRLGISDGWIAYRIEEMIRHGILEIVSEAEKDSLSYRRILRKTR
ncbi:MAG: DUF1835 domain-containing protein [Clostridia bacterium]|nr:DUF1835 domain-containing protein [Clostridia bacterium]